MKKSIISRTIIRNVAHVTLYKSDTKAISESVVIVPASVATVEKAERFIRKSNRFPVGIKLVSVDSIEKMETLVGMYLNTFVDNAIKVDERSKETRDAITKTVVAMKATVLYMTPDRKINETSVVIPQNVNYENYIRKNVSLDGRFIEIVSLEEVSTLYAMDEATFVNLAKPMKNKFQLDD